MKIATRHRMTAVALALGFAAALTPAAQAAFPDSDRSAPAGAPAAAPVSGSGGFDWADAAVGAGIALGGSALVGGTVVAVRRHGGRGRLATR